MFWHKFEDTGQRLEIAVNMERNLLEVRLVSDPTDREPRFERLPTLAEVEGYISLLGQVEDHLNRKKPASTALA